MIDENVLKNMISESNDNEYILELYNIYNITSRVVDYDFDNGKKILNKYEDDIYTIDGKLLTNQERLSLELKKIIRVNMNNTNLKSKEIVDRKIQNLLEIMDEVFDKNIDDNFILEIVKEKLDFAKDEAIFNMKRKISIIEAELNIPINFFYAASIAFIDIYKKYLKDYKKIN